jgi:hypothetical protein
MKAAQTNAIYSQAQENRGSAEPKSPDWKLLMA